MNPAADDSGPVIPTWELSDRLRKVRRDVLQAGQLEFAEQLGVSPQAVGSWESGRTHPRDIVALARRIEELSRVPASWFLGLDDAPGVAAVRRDDTAGEVARPLTGARAAYRNKA